MQPTKDDRSLGELFSDLARETGDLVKKEVTLARVEMTQKVTKLGKDAAMLAVGGMVLYAGLLTILRLSSSCLAQSASHGGCQLCL